MAIDIRHACALRARHVQRERQWPIVHPMQRRAGKPVRAARGQQRGAWMPRTELRRLTRIKRADSGGRKLTAESVALRVHSP